MSSVAHDEMLERLKKLQEAFSLALPNKLQAIDTLWLTVKQHTTSNSHDIHALYLAVHSLAGSAGTFGQEQVGEIARQLEQIIQQNLSDNMPVTNTIITIIETELKRLKDAIC